MCVHACVCVHVCVCECVCAHMCVCISLCVCVSNLPSSGDVYISGLKLEQKGMFSPELITFKLLGRILWLYKHAGVICLNYVAC